MKALLKILKDASLNEIGKIEHYLSEALVPNTNLSLNGQTVQVSDYPDLAKKIKENPSAFVDFSVTDTQITLPDYNGCFLKHDVQNAGVKSPDTMRRTLGSFWALWQSDLGDNTKPLGVFADSNQSNNNIDWTSGSKMTGNIFRFDSSLGVEGQEGAVSPNVGAVTEPQNVGVVFTIRATVNINFDNLVFEKISDFPEITNITGKYFLTDSGEKANLSTLINSEQK